MLGYYFFLAWKSIRRTPGNSLIVVAGIALGVAGATMFSAIYYTYARDPVPEKSGVLYYVRMDSWDPQKANVNGVPLRLTYQDMLGIMRSTIPVRQTASFPTSLRIAPKSDPDRSQLERARVCHADFFSMFNVPIRYGSGWTQEADEKGEKVVVIDDELNQRFFGGANSVGQVVTIEDHEFRVVGVLAPWQPLIAYYDLVAPHTFPVDRFFIPMGQVRPMELRPTGGSETWKVRPISGFEGWLHGEYSWVQVWVELPGIEQVVAYKKFLDGYALEQRRNGRFLRPLDNRVTPLRDFMKERGSPPPQATAMMVTANLFLVACSLSLMGLLWVRFFVRTAETGIRRALGANRRDIFLQHIIEAEVVALGGGIMGCVLSAISLQFVSMFYKTMSVWPRDGFFQMDGSMIAFAMAAAMVAGLFAGAYPAYLICRTSPASHLKAA